MEWNTDLPVWKDQWVFYKLPYLPSMSYILDYLLNLPNILESLIIISEKTKIT